MVNLLWLGQPPDGYLGGQPGPRYSLLLGYRLPLFRPLHVDDLDIVLQAKT